MWRWRWRTFWVAVPVAFGTATTLGGVLLATGVVLSFLNWGVPGGTFGRVTEFIFGVPFRPRVERGGSYQLSTLATTAALNIATWAALASVLAGGAVTAVAGFGRRRAGGP